MRFSIMMPVYNVEKYLGYCIDSFVNQTNKDFELILLDDGSTDNSGVLCDKYAAEYPDNVRVIHKQNEGLLLTRRRGLSEAKGEIFVFADSDDIAEPTLLEELDKAFEKYGADMVIYRFYRFISGGGEHKIYGDFPYADGTVFEGDNKKILYERFLLHHTFANMWLKAVRRDAVDITADYSDRNIRRCEDVLQSFPLFDSAKRIVCINKPLYHYRKFAESMTGTTRQADHKDYLTCTKASIEYIQKWELGEEVYHRYTAWQLAYYFNYLRNLSKETLPAQRKEVITDTIKLMLQFDVFNVIINDDNADYIPKRMRIRLKCFRRYLKGRKYLSVEKLVKLTNCIEKLIHS